MTTLRTKLNWNEKNNFKISCSVLGCFKNATIASNAFTFFSGKFRNEFSCFCHFLFSLNPNKRGFWRFDIHPLLASGIEQKDAKICQQCEANFLYNLFFLFPCHHLFWQDPQRNREKIFIFWDGLLKRFVKNKCLGHILTSFLPSSLRHFAYVIAINTILQTAKYH